MCPSVCACVCVCVCVCTCICQALSESECVYDIVCVFRADCKFEENVTAHHSFMSAQVSTAVLLCPVTCSICSPFTTHSLTLSLSLSLAGKQVHCVMKTCTHTRTH